MIDTLWLNSEEMKRNDALNKWMCAIIWPGMNLRIDDCVAMTVMDNNQLIAVMAFHDWDPKAGRIEITGASVNKRWLTRPVLRDMFSYCFNLCECQLVVMKVSARPEQRHLHRMLTAYGFEKALIKRMYGRHEDGYVFTLTDDTWRSNGFHRSE